MMRTVTSRRVKRAPIVRVSISKDLTGEVLPPILLAPSVLPGLLATRDCSESRAIKAIKVDPVDLNSSRSGKENNIRAFPSRF